jgi:hypothetical protein
LRTLDVKKKKTQPRPGTNPANKAKKKRPRIQLEPPAPVSTDVLSTPHSSNQKEMASSIDKAK